MISKTTKQDYFTRDKGKPVSQGRVGDEVRYSASQAFRRAMANKVSNSAKNSKAVKSSNRKRQIAIILAVKEKQARDKIKDKISETKKRLIANKMARTTKESPRQQEIREINESNRISSLKMTAKKRHDRRHGQGKRTSLQQRQEWMRMMSKDS